MKLAIRDTLASIAVGVGGTVLVVGLASMFLAKHFWLADLLVNFQAHYVMCLLACLFTLVLTRRQLTAAGMLLGTLILALPIIPYLKLPFKDISTATPKDNDRVYSLLTYNVLTSNTRMRDVADYIASEGTDFLLLIETDKVWSDEMDFELRDHFPHRFTEPRSDNFGLTFYSKLPWKSIRLHPETDLPALEVHFSLPEGELTLLGVHPVPPVRPPNAEIRNAYLQTIAQHVADLPESVIVAGDFNATPWSPHFQQVLADGQLKDSGVGRGIQNTWYRLPVLLLGLPIDHVLTRNLAIMNRRVGPPIGSDHRPLHLDFLLQNDS